MIRGVLIVAAFVLHAAMARADVAMAWSSDAGIIVVAHDSRIEGFDRTGEERLWSAEGLDNPSAIVISQDGKRAAILDGFDDRVAVVTLADGAVELYDILGTPVAAAFFGRDVWIVLRDHSKVVRITPEGKETEVSVALDPAFLAVSDKFVYVYSRAEGWLQEIDPKLAQVSWRLLIGVAGSDLEIRLPTTDAPVAGAVAFVCRPVSGQIMAIDLVKKESRELHAGVAPIDLMFVPFGAMLSHDPSASVVADPGLQALLLSQDPGRGKVFSQPMVPDRLMITRAGIFAFDSSSGSVYRVEGRTTTKIASGLTATSFVPTDEALFTWDATAGKPRRETIAK